MTGYERIKTKVRKRQLRFPGALVWQGNSRLSKRITPCLGVWGCKGPRSTGDVLGVLPAEKYLRLRGDPAQRQRTEMGCIRSCYHGWTGLDDCCEKCGHVAPFSNALRRVDLHQTNEWRQREAS